MSPAAGSLDFLTARPFAHRGLHSPGIPENSLAAARAAISEGYGIECDVRLSRDKVVHVFHDTQLGRLTGRAGRFGALSANEIAGLRLRGSDEPVPTLAALLALTGDVTPLLIEIKSGNGLQACAALCSAVAATLADARRPAAVMSFDPQACHWFRRHRPDIPRGLVIRRRHRTAIVARHGVALAIARARPHFIACDVRDLPKACALPRRLHRPLLCWTVRSDRDAERAARHVDQIIFERIA